MEIDILQVPEVSITCTLCGHEFTRRHAAHTYVRNEECPECCELGCLTFTDGDTRSNVTARDRVQALFQEGELSDFDALSSIITLKVRTDEERPSKVGRIIAEAYLANDVDAMLIAICGYGMDTLLDKMDYEESRRDLEL